MLNAEQELASAQLGLLSNRYNEYVARASLLLAMGRLDARTVNSAIPAKDPDEDALLEGVAAELRPESRLACQIVMSPALVGLVVRVPERQV